MHISVKCSAAIHCLVLIGAYGDRPRKITGELLSQSSGVNAVTIRTILSALKKDGILTINPGKGGATLNCPPEEISLYRVYAAIEPDFLTKLIGIHPEPSEACPVGRCIHGVLECSYSKVREDLKRSLESITLDTIIADYKRLHEEDKRRQGLI